MAQQAVIELRGWVADDWVAEGWVAKKRMLVVYLDADEVVALQQAGVPVSAKDIDAFWIAAHVLEFWRHFPALQSPTEEPPTP